MNNSITVYKILRKRTDQLTSLYVEQLNHDLTLIYEPRKIVIPSVGKLFAFDDFYNVKNFLNSVYSWGIEVWKAETSKSKGTNVDLYYGLDVGSYSAMQSLETIKTFWDIIDKEPLTEYHFDLNGKIVHLNGTWPGTVLCDDITLLEKSCISIKRYG
jgi:hypothetical protein